jgi:hypothetical protein
MGAVANLAPELFAGILADVPFVDALTTILDPSLPLTVIEWDEWGDPLHDAEVYAYMKSYTPYENVREGVTYPRILATTSLNDTRVYYVEPAKWVARLREVGADALLKCEMVAGHGGVSGRYNSWQQRAFELAWLLDAGPRRGLIPPPRTCPARRGMSQCRGMSHLCRGVSHLCRGVSHYLCLTALPGSRKWDTQPGAAPLCPGVSARASTPHAAGRLVPSRPRAGHRRRGDEPARARAANPGREWPPTGRRRARTDAHRQRGRGRRTRPRDDSGKGQIELRDERPRSSNRFQATSASGRPARLSSSRKRVSRGERTPPRASASALRRIPPRTSPITSISPEARPHRQRAPA